MENLIEMDDLGVPLLLETPILGNISAWPLLTCPSRLCKPRHGLGVQRWFDGAVRASQQIPSLSDDFEFSRLMLHRFHTLEINM